MTIDTPNSLVDLAAVFQTHNAALNTGDYGALVGAVFSSFALSEQGHGKTVVSFHYTPEWAQRVNLSLRYVDLFILAAGNNLGLHYHRHSTARIYVLQGSGSATIGDQHVAFEAGDQFTFPRTVPHDVRADPHKGPVIFASFQDHPILSDHGLDYHPL